MNCIGPNTIIDMTDRIGTLVSHCYRHKISHLEKHGRSRTNFLSNRLSGLKTEAPGSLYIQARRKTFIWKIVWLLLIVFAK